MKFSKNMQNAMKDTILSLMWSKQDIIEFFKENSCTSSELKIVQEHKKMSRVKIVEKVFNALTSRKDSGIGQFNSILDSLCNWNYFNPYYFDKLKKLNRNEAEKAIGRLKRARLKMEYQLRDQQNLHVNSKKSVSSLPDLTQLKEIYTRLFQKISIDGKPINNRQRGYEFEKFISLFFKVNGIDVSEPFKIEGEQIDGSVKYDGEHYLLEMKWHDSLSATEPLYSFAHKIEGKMYGRGIFISVNGYSEGAVKSLMSGKATKTILIDGQDIFYVLEERIGLTDMLDNKIQAAQTRGQIYIDPYSGKSKI